MANSYPTRRWRGVVAVALLAGAVGVITTRPALLAVAVIGVVFAAYPAISRPPRVDLSIDRRVSTPNPAPGENVDVTITVTNTGGSLLPDLRIADGVPGGLRVVEGSPRHGIALRPGQSASYSYVLEAKSGRHAFEPAIVVARDFAGGWELETTIEADTDLDCSAGDGSVALSNPGGVIAGHIRSNRGGVGTEFHQTREYRHGDAANRINWNRYARTGELSTVEYAVEQAVTVMVVVDCRAESYRGQPDRPHAVIQCVTVARAILHSLHSHRNLVGLIGVGRDSCWLDPAAGRDHVAEADRLFSTSRVFSSVPYAGSGDGARNLSVLHEHLPNAAQAVICSPLLDDAIVRTAMKIHEEGHPVTVVTPDVTGHATLGQQIARLERANRVSTLRRAGVAVFDWTPTNGHNGSPEREWRGMA